MVVRAAWPVFSQSFTITYLYIYIYRHIHTHIVCVQLYIEAPTLEFLLEPKSLHPETYFSNPAP